MKRENIFLILFFIPFFIGNLSATSQKQPLKNTDYKPDLEFSKNSDLVIAGMVLKREEIWDRRPNPLMGRPDILKEVIYVVKIETLYSGELQDTGKQLTVSIKERKLLLRFRMLIKKERGFFYLTRNKSPYTLLHFQSNYRPKVEGKIKPQPVTKKNNVATNEYYDSEKKYTKNELEDMLETPVRIASKHIFASEKLQINITGIIGEKYKMKNPALVTMVSHRGPRPPEGGYKYWGVKGKINGIWYIWQFGKLKKGIKLKDPKRFQK